jgi:hypothetical protein
MLKFVILPSAFSNISVKVAKILIGPKRWISKLMEIETKPLNNTSNLRYCWNNLTIKLFEKSIKTKELRVLGDYNVKFQNN